MCAKLHYYEKNIFNRNRSNVLRDRIGSKGREERER